MIEFVWDMWTDGWSGKFMLFLLTVSVALVAVVPYAIYQAHKVEVACRARGGEMVVVGQHQGFMPIMVGKTTVMMPHTYTDYACSVPEEVQP